MNAHGKRKLIKSLSASLQDWFDEIDPNSEESTDVGWLGDDYIKQLATIVVTALELNRASQEYMEKEGLLAVSVI